MAQSGYYSIHYKTGETLIHLKRSTCTQNESVLFRTEKDASKFTTIYPLNLSLFPEQLCPESLSLHILGVLRFSKHLGNLNTVLIKDPSSRDSTLHDLLIRYLETLCARETALRLASCPDLEFKTRFDKAFRGKILSSVITSDNHHIRVDYSFDGNSGNDSSQCIHYRNLDVSESHAKEEFAALLSRLALSLNPSISKEAYKLIIGFVADILRQHSEIVGRDIPTLVPPDLKTPFVLV